MFVFVSGAAAAAVSACCSHYCAWLCSSTNMLVEAEECYIKYLTLFQVEIFTLDM